MKTDEELRQIAVDMYDGKIFSDRHLRNIDDIHIVFMPITLGALHNMPEEERRNIGMIYEYMSERGPRDVNGYPTFFSLKILTQEEAGKMFVHFEEYREMKDKFLNKKEES